MRDEQELEHSTFIIDLDCLLDTRLGTAITIHPSGLLGWLKEGYHERVQDVFTGIDPEVYGERYRNRDVEVLKNSTLTPMMDVLKEFALETLKNINETPFHYKPKILLNTYPYKDLSDEEQSALVEVVVHCTKEMADVELCYRSLEELHPVYLKSNVSIIAMYNYLDWLERYSEDETFSRVSLPEVTLLAPAIVFKDTEVDKSTLLEDFKSLEMGAGVFVGLRLLSIDMFSTKLTLEELIKASKAIKVTS